MCGILGEIDFNNQELNIDSFKKNIETLKNRGPDDVGYWNYENFIQLGFTRLSIIDLDPRSNQPMQSNDKNIVMVFNGEIYNYKELRVELEALGFSFKTGSDTEVLLQSLMVWGTNCLPRLVGMFSFVLYDTKNSDIFVARDPIGIIPLYYGITEAGEIMFASEAKCLKEDCPFITTFPPGNYLKISSKNNLTSKIL